MPHCALTPADWRARCANTGQDFGPACAALAATQFPEAATLDLNLLASETGEFPGGFGDLRFSHPARSTRTVREWVEELANDPAALERLAFDANRAFDGCDGDRGVLFPSATLALCQPDGVTGELTGPRGYVCDGLSDECSRGSERVLDGTACCELVPRADGIVCDGGAGTCNGGACVPVGFTPPGGPFMDSDASAPDAGPPSDNPPSNPPSDDPATPLTLGYLGDEHWIDVVGDHSVGLSLADGGFRVLVGGEAWVELPEVDPSSDPNGDGSTLAEVRLSRHEGLNAIGVLAPRSVRAILLPASEPQQEYCVVRGDPGDPRIALSDCSTRGERLRCDGDLQGIECNVVEGLVRFEAPDILMAWPIPDSAQPILDVFGALHLCIPIPGLGCIDIGRPVCRFGDTRTCQPPCGDGNVGISFCTALGRWGRCISFTRRTDERCNGRDDDCDGITDESTAAACSDGRSCNVDVCTDGVCEYLVSPSCDDSLSTACSSFFCRGPIELPLESQVVRTPLGCRQLLRHGECSDGCDCNRRELCSPTMTGPLGSGCFPAAGLNPCENSDPVDYCSNAYCCSGNVANCLRSPWASPTLDLGGLPAGNLSEACDEARDRGLLFDVPFDPANPSGYQIECVRETTIEIGLFGVFGEFDTFSEQDCDPLQSDEVEETRENQDCVDYGSCVPSTGLCLPAFAAGRPLGGTGTQRLCNTDAAGNRIPGPFSCGFGECNGDQTGCGPGGCPLAACERRPLPSGNCAEEELLGANRPRRSREHRFFREGYTTSGTDLGSRLQYRGQYRSCPGPFDFICDTAEAEFESCHFARCSPGSFQCSYVTDTSVCPLPPLDSCLSRNCSMATNVYSGDFSYEDPSAIIGCELLPVNARCTRPPNSECLRATCNPDGTCRFDGDDALCRDVPPGNVCLVPACLDDGTCGTAPDHNRCPLVVPCGGELPTRFCQPDGQCLEPCND